MRAQTRTKILLFRPGGAEKQNVRTGAGNVWSIISADPSLGLVYLPVGSAAPDLYGGMRPGDNRDANSIVALDAATGKKVWAFQVVPRSTSLATTIALGIGAAEGSVTLPVIPALTSCAIR